MRIVLAMAILLSSTLAYSQTDTPKQQQIVKIMELTQAHKLLDNMMRTFKESFKESYPDVDQKFWNEFFEEISTKDLVNMNVAIYDKHFNEEEVKGLLAFYESPLGKKVIEKMPLIMQESMLAGQQWGSEVGQKVLARLQEEEK